jgi:hypothetical protein
MSVQFEIAARSSASAFHVAASHRSFLESAAQFLCPAEILSIAESHIPCLRRFSLFSSAAAPAFPFSPRRFQPDAQPAFFHLRPQELRLPKQAFLQRQQEDESKCLFLYIHKQFQPLLPFQGGNEPSTAPESCRISPSFSAGPRSPALTSCSVPSSCHDLSRRHPELSDAHRGPRGRSHRRLQVIKICQQGIQNHA